MKYRPDLNFVYPDQVDGHMISPKPVADESILSPEYPYYDRSFFFVLKQNLMQLFLLALVIPVARIRYGLRIKGRKVLKKYRKELRKGAISVCNHVFEWDYLCIRAAISPRKQYVTIWKNNLLGPLGPTFRVVGAVFLSPVETLPLSVPLIAIFLSSLMMAAGFISILKGPCGIMKRS